MAATTEQHTNPTNLDRRRDERQEQVERVTERVMQESIGRMSEIAGTAVEIQQKQVALGSAFLHYWGDCFAAVQNSMSGLVHQANKLSEQARDQARRQA